MEKLDYYSKEGKYLGTATRDKVHRLGLWHKTVHCWLYDSSGNVYFQIYAKRGTLYTTASGHVLAGETIEQAFGREVKEELGLNIDCSSAIEVDVVPFQLDKINPDGTEYHDRAMAHVYVCQTNARPHEFKFDIREVSGVVRVNAAEAIEFLKKGKGKLKSVTIKEVGDKNLSENTTTDFIDFLVNKGENAYEKYGKVLHKIVGLFEESQQLKEIENSRIITSVVRRIESTFKPLSIFVYDSNVDSGAQGKNDMNLGVIFEDNKYVERKNIIELISSGTTSITPFKLSEITSHDVETLFQKNLFIKSLANGGAKTVYGDKIVEELKEPKVTAKDLLMDTYFNLGRAMSAVQSNKNEKIKSSAAANELFYKSCLLCARNLVYFSTKKFPVTYLDIYIAAIKLELPKEYISLLETAYSLRNEPNKKLDTKYYYSNIKYINQFVLEVLQKQKDIKSDI